MVSGLKEFKVKFPGNKASVPRTMNVGDGDHLYETYFFNDDEHPLAGVNVYFREGAPDSRGRVPVKVEADYQLNEVLEQLNRAAFEHTFDGPGSVDFNVTDPKNSRFKVSGKLIYKGNQGR